MDVRQRGKFNSNWHPIRKLMRAFWSKRSRHWTMKWSA
jgi:hypothetical protein